MITVLAVAAVWTIASVPAGLLIGWWIRTGRHTQPPTTRIEEGPRR